MSALGAAQIAKALDAKSLSSGGWAAKCPAHDDNNPSLSISEGDNGKPLVRCHAGCEQSDVIAALCKRNLWPSNDEIPLAHFQLGPYSSHWDYTDASGAHVMRICRWEPSTGKTIRPLTLQGGRWQWKSFERDRPLYRLTTLKGASKCVLVVEGEKAADAALALFPDFNVTTWAGGAKATAKTDLSPLKGRDVILWPDNDRPGRDAMNAMAKRLQDIAASVRMFEPNDIRTDIQLPEGWDAADALADTYYDLQALREGLTNAKVWTEIDVAANAPSDARRTQPGDIASSSTPVVRCLADVTPQPISWLWPGRIARGKVTLIAGDPGLGKSQLTAALAACVSVGGRWPVDRSVAPHGNALFLNAEDDAADTIRPRLDAAGADVSRIHVLDAVRVLDNEGWPVQRSFDLARDIEALRGAAGQIGDVALIIIDPISAYLGGTDTHRNADVRGVLAPLSALAADISAAVLIVSHLNKSAGSDAMMRVTGSLAFVAAARAAYVVVRDAQDPARRLFLPAKNNLGPDQGAGLAFRVVPITIENDIATSRTEWETEPVTITANEALAATLDDPEERGARTEAEDFLRELLANGPMAAKDVERAAKEAGQSKATTRRAKKALDIIVDKEGYQGAWRWSLPSKVLKLSKDAQQKDVSTFGGDEHLWADDADSEVI